MRSLHHPEAAFHRRIPSRALIFCRDVDVDDRGLVRDLDIIRPALDMGHGSYTAMTGNGALTCGTFQASAAARWSIRWMRFRPYVPLSKMLGDFCGSRELRLRGAGME